mgnify:CR=1 FL=1
MDWLLLSAVLLQGLDASYTCNKLSTGHYKEVGSYYLFGSTSCKKIVMAKSTLFVPLVLFDDKNDKRWKIFLMTTGGVGLSVSIALDKDN